MQSREAKRQMAEEVDEVEEKEQRWHLASDHSELLKESYTTSPQMEDRGVRGMSKGEYGGGYGERT